MTVTTAGQVTAAWAQALPPAELARKVQLVAQGSMAFTPAQRAALLAAAGSQT